MREEGELARLEIGGLEREGADEERKKEDGPPRGQGLQKKERVAQEGGASPAPTKTGKEEPKSTAPSASLRAGRMAVPQEKEKPKSTG